MKRTKQDKQFWIQFDQSNSFFLSNVATFMLSYVISLVSLLISVIALIFAIVGFSAYSVVAAMCFLVIILLASRWFTKRVRRNVADATAIHEQLQRELLALYPEYKDKMK
ncbi:MAG: hypothetical protein ABIH41_03285 [Nanoarchaeota archaeon]